MFLLVLISDDSNTVSFWLRWAGVLASLANQWISRRFPGGTPRVAVDQRLERPVLHFNRCEKKVVWVIVASYLHIFCGWIQFRCLEGKPRCSGSLRTWDGNSFTRVLCWRRCLGGGVFASWHQLGLMCTRNTYIRNGRSLTCVDPANLRFLWRSEQSSRSSGPKPKRVRTNSGLQQWTREGFFQWATVWFDI